MILQHRRWRAILFVWFMPITACHSADGQALQKPAMWRTLPDGSRGKTWSFAGSDGNISTFAERCWPKERQLDCLEATSIGPAIFAKRYRKAAIDDASPSLGSDRPQSGYACSRTGEVVREYVFRDSPVTTLISNQFDLAAWALSIDSSMPITQRPAPGNWSRDHVERYMLKNAISPNFLYLDCLGITQTVREGSADSINTTSVSYDGMQGEPTSMLDR